MKSPSTFEVKCQHLEVPSRIPRQRFWALPEGVEPVACENSDAAFAELGKREQVARMHQQLDDVFSTRDQMEQLLQSIVDIGSHPELDKTLRQIPAMAWELAAGRDREHRLGILADRDRIAHELRDHVIQRLFAAGLDLEGAIARSRSLEMTGGLTTILDNVHSTIEDIRATIFDLKAGMGPSEAFLRRVRRLVAELTADLDIATTLITTGPMTAVGSELAEHAAMVMVQAISNTVSDSGASRLTVGITAGDMFTLDVIDDGDGTVGDEARSGLADMLRRAERLGGTCQISSPPDGGTHLRWTAPLPA